MTTKRTSTSTSSSTPSSPFTFHGRKKLLRSDLYSVSFRDSHEQDPVLVAVGSNLATIFIVQPTLSSKDPNGLRQVHEFVDRDTKEDLFCCEWSLDRELFLVAGERGIIKAMHFEDKALKFALVGHGGAVHDVKRHPTDSNVLFSCSTDESIRMWNVRERRAMCMFVGDQGHRDAVLSIDLHYSGQWLISSGIDNTVKIWNLDKLQPMEARAMSSSSSTTTTTTTTTTHQPFKAARLIQFPEFSTRSVHANYVDCVRFVGDLVLTKSLESKLWLWTPDIRRRPNSVTLLREFCYPTWLQGKLWYERFSLNADASRVAVGGDSGGVAIFDVDSGQLLQRCHTSENFTGSVRSTAFSPNNAFVVATCSQGYLWCWHDATTARHT